MEQYLAEDPVDTKDTNFDVLGWWRENRSRYPTLSRMARDVLAIPACAYSVEENLNLDLAVLQGVSPEVLEATICSKNWILSDVQSPQENFQRRDSQQQLVLQLQMFLERGLLIQTLSNNILPLKFHVTQLSKKKFHLAHHQLLPTQFSFRRK